MGVHLSKALKGVLLVYTSLFSVWLVPFWTQRVTFETYLPHDLSPDDRPQG